MKLFRDTVLTTTDNGSKQQINNQSQKGIQTRRKPRTITEEAATTDWIKQNGFLACVHRGYESPYTPSLGIVCSNSFCESLLKGFLLLRVRASESAFSVYAHYCRERPLGGGTGV